MAIEVPLFTPGVLKAGASLSGKQYYFVKLDSNGDVVVCAAVTDQPIGILQNEPASGEAAEVMMAGISKVSADAALAIGDLIGTSADGQAAAYVAGTDTTKYIVGKMLSAPGAAARLGTCMFQCLSLHRGA